MYDIIGDLHGHAKQLETMLKTLGYEKETGIYRHPDRKTIFVGDIINRGPAIRKTVQIVKAMVEAGAAFAILGNHEMNAIMYATLDKAGKVIQKRLPRYKLPLMKTLEEYEKFPEEWKETVKWFRTLPFYLNFGDLRIVHGGWNDEHIRTVNRYMAGEPKMRKHFMKAYLTDPVLAQAVDGLLKGVEFQLPKDIAVKNSNGLSVRRYRIKWWDDTRGKTFNQISFEKGFSMPEYTVPEQIAPPIKPYASDLPPVFFGHYCMNNGPYLVASNLCCIDGCITRSGILTAYRWDGEQTLNEANIIQVTF